MSSPPPDLACPHCGMWHLGTCPRVRRIEYYPNGTVRVVEYHAEAPPPGPADPGGDYRDREMRPRQ